MKTKKIIFSFIALTMIFADAFAAKPKLSSEKNSASEKSNAAEISSSDSVRSPEKKREKAQMIFDAVHVNAALEAGDCAYLYAFAQSENPDSALLAKANAVLKFYTGKSASLSQFHTDKMDAKVRRVPKEISEGVFQNPKEFLPQLAAFLANGVQSDFAKVKIFHDWICDNIAYDAQMYFSGRVSSQDYASVIKKRKAVCAGYASCINAMCSLAGIESKTISGFSKGAGFSGKTGTQPDHDWNAVKINGRWYLLDATWDAGYLDYKTFIKRYSTQYLFWDARTFLYSHLAQDDPEQFYAPVLSKEQFEKEPKIEGKFFQKGLSLADDKLHFSNETSGEFQVQIKMNGNLFVTNELFDDRGFVEGASWTKRKGGTVTFCYDVPDGADYQGGIYVRETSPYQFVISIPEFEGKWIPAAEKLFAEKKITQKEKEYFEGAYFKIGENRRYYLADDQFASARNAALAKIAKLVEPDVVHSEPVLTFNLKAAANYPGFGAGNLKYPYRYMTYNNAANTELIAPLAGKLKSGTKQKFEIRSGNFTKFAFIINGEWHFFEKNAASGNFELEFEIPSGEKQLQLFASANGKNFGSLIAWNLEK
ncbi:MAG: hypothetical protein NC041_08435 [Bacteroides sp.]|nr:hypothetical protein [Prevotella sp.]MCM1408290.1 hypothetical protein [Treponema brennaborense]MCM1470478.1 hypothetical protein [Bacteroides sp.]